MSASAPSTPGCVPPATSSPNGSAREDIVVVSHVSPIKAAVAWALNTSLEIMFHCHLAQASVCRVAMGKFGPMLHTFNEQPVRI